MQRLRLILYCIGTALIIGSIAGIALVFHISSFSKSSVFVTPPGKHFQIRMGQNLKTVSTNLQDKGIITNSFLFQMVVRFKGLDKKIQAGEYTFIGNVTPEQVIKKLVQGKVTLYKITIPEGYNIKETAQLIEEKGFCNAGKFVALCHEKEYLESFGLSADSLEGYLFPETYFFPKGTTCTQIISAMISRFNKSFPQEWDDRAKSLGLSRHDVVILASIIEKETGSAPERPLISSVFHNRLKKGMRLESDPTVIYGIKNFDGNITRKHLRTPTPYNTYTMRGLPKGPIANPGKLSLKAALYPVTSPYLFFVSKKNGTHYFSKTVQEHNRAVKKYLLSR